MLSELQKHIINCIGDTIVNSRGDNSDCDDWRYTEIRYRTAFEAAADWWWKGVPALPDEPRYRVAQQSFSRAAWTLVEKDILAGVALAWCDARTGDYIRWQGGGPTSYRDGHAGTPRPQLKMLGLSHVGWKYHAALQEARTQ